MGCTSSSSKVSKEKQQELHGDTAGNSVHQKYIPTSESIPHMQNKKQHIMLSYDHSHQELVLRVYEFLNSRRIRVWLDVKSGMGEYILDSMAAAVQDSAVVVCFLTREYQNSSYCKDEFKYARKKNKPIIPCLIQPGWKPDGWLDMGISDMLYINFKKNTEHDFNSKCEELLEKIQQLAKSGGYLLDEDDPPLETITVENVPVDLDEEPNYASIHGDYSSMVSSSVRQGPDISTETFDVTKLTKHVCEGDSSVHLMLISQRSDEDIYANQDTFARNGKFLNYFFIPKLVFQNVTDKPISILCITAEYEDSQGTWCNCQSVKIAPPVLDYNVGYHWLPNTLLNLESKKLETFAVRVDISIQGEPGVTGELRGRAHKSLPQPLKIRVTLQDTEEKTARLILEQVNKPLILPTEERLMERFNFENIIKFVYADDCNLDGRYWVIIDCPEEFKIRISFGCDLHGCQKKDLDRRLIKWLYNEAKRSNSTELVLTEWSDDRRKIIALFDSKSFILFGLRIELTTTTSKTIESVLLPLEKLKARLAIEKEHMEN